MLSFRVTPRKDRIDVFVTKSEISKDLNLEDLADMEDIAQMSPEDFFKTLEQNMRDKGDAEALDRLAEAEKAEETAASSEEETAQEFVHFVLDFDSIEDVVRFAQAVNFDVEASELFKVGDNYYMTVLLNLIDKPSYYLNLMHARILEYASPGTKTRAYLLEHGVQLLSADTLAHLKMIGQ